MGLHPIRSIRPINTRVRVCVLSISGWAYQEPVALELATKSAPLSVGTSSGWVLEMEMEAPETLFAVVFGQIILTRQA